MNTTTRSLGAVMLAIACGLVPACGDDAANGGDAGSPANTKPKPTATPMPDAGVAADAAVDVPAPRDLVDLFEAAWGEPDAAKRHAILERTFAADGKLVFQDTIHDGRNAAAAAIDSFDRQTNDHCEVVEFSGVVQDYIRFTATCIARAGTGDSHFTKYGHLDADGRLDLLVLFNDPIAKVAVSADLETVTAIADTFEAAWTEADDDARLAMLRSMMVEDAFYMEPPGKSEGVAAISEYMAINADPLWDRLEVTGGPQEQQGYLRFAVRGINMDGSVSFVGEKFALLAGTDKVAYIVYFAGMLPADAGAP